MSCPPKFDDNNKIAARKKKVLRGRHKDKLSIT